MPKTKQNKSISYILIRVFIVALCAAMLALDYIPIQYVQDGVRNVWISTIVQQCVGAIAIILLMLHLKIKLFGKIHAWLYLLPCLIVALDNFPLISYINGNMRFTRTGAWDFVLFALYCLAIGLFEECVFRGVLFSVIASLFSQDKKGFFKTFVVSSAVFGLAHLFNLLSGAGIGATLLQVCYTTLTGGLFAFAMIKTKNVLCAAFVHGLYNFCGLLLSEQGLGSGIVFDVGTGVMMGIISVIIGVFVLYSVWKYTEAERSVLYKHLGIEKHKAQE